MITFAFRGTIADIDETTPDGPCHPATVLIIETGDTFSRVVVPEAGLRDKRALLCVGRPVQVLGEVRDWLSNRGSQHVVTELKLAGPTH